MGAFAEEVPRCPEPEAEPEQGEKGVPVGGVSAPKWGR